MARRSRYIPGDFELVAKRSSAGLGLYTNTAIPRGACIIEYVGRLLPKAEEYTSRSKYLFGVGRRMIDGKPKWNKAGYINHSCVPNAEPVIHRGRVFIMALRRIEAGEELTYDYGEEYFDEHIKPHCRCAKHA